MVDLLLVDEEEVSVLIKGEPETLGRYARDSGFTRVDVAPIENDFFRFYRLIP